MIKKIQRKYFRKCIHEFVFVHSELLYQLKIVYDKSSTCNICSCSLTTTITQREQRDFNVLIKNGLLLKHVFDMYFLMKNLTKVKDTIQLQGTVVFF